MYNIIFSDTALKQFNKLPQNIKERIIAVLKRCKIRPHSFAKKLVGSPYFRLRTGNYRIIIEIQNNQLQILVIEVGHRRNIYG